MLKDIRQKPADLSEIVLLMVHKEGGAYGIPEANCTSNVWPSGDEIRDVMEKRNSMGF